MVLNNALLLNHSIASKCQEKNITAEHKKQKKLCDKDLLKKISKFKTAKSSTSQLHNEDSQQEDCQLWANIGMIATTAMDSLAIAAASSKKSETEGLTPHKIPVFYATSTHGISYVPAPMNPSMTASPSAPERAQEASNPTTYNSDAACWDKIDKHFRTCWVKMGP